MNKKLLLLAGILVLGATTFAAHTPAGEEGKTISAEKAAEISTITDSSAIEGLIATRQTGEAGFSGSYAGEVRVRSWQGPGRSDKNKDLDTTGGTAKANTKNTRLATENPDNYQHSVNKIEWTVAKGKINMGRVGFKYDVDRDYNFDKDWNKTNEAWDTEFALDYQGGTFDMMGKEWTFVPSVAFGYDKSENYTSKASDPSARDSETKRLFKFNPQISTTYYGFAMDVSPILAYDDVEGTTAFQLDVTNYRKLSDTWSLAGDFYFDFAGSKNDGSYHNDVFAVSGGIDENDKFDFSIEQYLTYEKGITENVYFVTEFGLEAYSLLSSTKNDVSMYAAPEVQYRAKLGSVNITPYAKYISYTATGWAAGDSGKEELSAGVRFGTKF